MSDQVIQTGAGSEGQGQEKYGISNLEYDIVTTMSNLLQSQEALDRYAQDAESAGDTNSASLFREIRENNRRYAQQLRNSLTQRVSNS